jgi:DNA-binding NarL/FixJ family response regulator
VEPVTSDHHPGTHLRVVIAEDSVLLLAGLTKLLEAAGFQVAASAGDADGLLAAVERERPDVVIADVRMPPSHTDEGIRAALVIRSQWPDIAILVLSQYVEERYAADLLSSNTRGVGYLLKDRVADVAEFLDALRRVAAGGTALDPEVVAQLLVRRRGDPLDDLTQRERDVLALMAEGRSRSARPCRSPTARWASTSTRSSPSSGCTRATSATAGCSRCCATSRAARSRQHPNRYV